MQEKKTKPALGKKTIVQNLRQIGAVMRLLGVNRIRTCSDFDDPLNFKTIEYFDKDDCQVGGFEMELEEKALEYLKHFGIPVLESKSERYDSAGCSISFFFDDDSTFLASVTYEMEHDNESGWEGPLVELLDDKTHSEFKANLEAHGIKRFIGEFSGGSDSGGFDTIQFYDDKDSIVNLPTEFENPIINVIENMTWSQLDIYGFDGEISVSGTVELMYKDGDFEVDMSKKEWFNEDQDEVILLPKL
jgi:hypothetical protein